MAVFYWWNQKYVILRNVSNVFFLHPIEVNSDIISGYYLQVGVMGVKESGVEKGHHY